VRLTGIPVLSYSRITPLLYVGPQIGWLGKLLLEQLHIQHSINLRQEFDDASARLALLHYCYLPTIDDEAPTVEHLQRGIAFIEQAEAKGERVYIHCAGGMGRAPTMCAAYLIHQGMSLEGALTLIRYTRPFVQLSDAQMSCLRAFEAAVQC
jgi:protein-tyrosine phosphatase